MKISLIFLTCFTAANLFAANRPYTEVIDEISASTCSKKKENIFLTKEQRKKIESLSETKLYGGLALRYVTSCENEEIVYHYVDSHIVRTLNETVVVSIKNDQVINYVVSSFSEPPEYKAPQKWYMQFIGKKPNKALKAYEDIDGLSGATLTVNSSISAVNRILAMHKILAAQSE